MCVGSQYPRCALFNALTLCTVCRAAREVNFKPTTICYRENPNAPLVHHNHPASHWASLGVTHTLDEVFDAPMTVKHVLNDSASITSTFLARSEDCMDGIFQNSTITIAYSDRTRSQAIKSR